MAELSDLDVLLEGEGIRRDVDVRLEEDGLELDDIEVRYEDIFWISRRVGLLMVFAEGRTLAVKGERKRLERLVHGLEGRIGGRSGRGRLPTDLTREVVLCTAGTAVVGRIRDRRASGLRVAVFTRRGLHLLGGERPVQVSWPADEAREVEAEGAPGPALLLRKGESVFRLLYLFPEERKTVIRLAREEPPPASGSGDRSPRPGGSKVEDEPGERAAVAEPDGEGSPESERPEGSGGGEDGTGPEAADARAGGGEDEHRPGTESAAEEDTSLELFARGEVAPPVRSELPEMRLSVAVLQAAAEEAAASVPPGPAETAGLAPHFLETHLVELGEIALGPVLLRKSAAASASSLRKAVEAMDAGELREDARAAVGNAANRLAEVYADELDRLVSEKRAPPRVEEEHALGMEELEELRLRLLAPVDRLVPLLREMEEAQVRLLERLRKLEAGPPDAEEQQVEAAREAWSECLGRVDRAFERAWKEMVGEAADAWEDRMLPSLAEVGGMRRRRLPEWATVGLLAAATLLMAAAAMILLIW